MKSFDPHRPRNAELSAKGFGAEYGLLAGATKDPAFSGVPFHHRRVPLGGGGKLEFTLIGDTVNVVARVEHLTKTTGDTILLAPQCVGALASRPPGLIDRGFHVLNVKLAKGKWVKTAAPITLATPILSLRLSRNPQR
jgi:hypothetical protein